MKVFFLRQEIIYLVIINALVAESFTVRQPSEFGRNVIDSPRTTFPLRVAESNEDNQEDQQNDSEESFFRLLNYRKKKSPMVRPINWQDGKISSDEEEPKKSTRKSKLESFFGGMPSMSEILSGELENEEEPRESKKRSFKKNVDDSWFNEKRQQIIDNYQEILNEMLKQLQEQSLQDPDSVPPNAQAMIQSVLKQEMDREIEETKERLELERLQAYEQSARQKVDEDESVEVTEGLQKLIDESEEEYQQKQTLLSQIEDFKKYQEEAYRMDSKYSVKLPDSGSNLDEWALDRLRDMQSSRQDGEEAILDILEENVQNLQSRLQKEANRGSLQPETLKEWQMYRAIATRLTGGDTEAESSREEDIRRQLDSWKGYIEKEDQYRRDSGLSRGPKVPFEWQELQLEKANDSPQADRPDIRSRREARREVNRRSINAMENLMAKSDGPRREKLQREIEYLRSTLEANDYLDIEMKDDEDKNSVDPIDLKGLFTSYTENVEFDELPRTREVPYSIKKGNKSVVEMPNDVSSPIDYAEQVSKTPPPPKTPFFSDIVDESNKSASAVKDDSKLGSMNEQKMQSMFRRAGARTKEEQDMIRKNWEEYQIYESERRDESGLSGYSDTESDSNRKADLKYDVSEVLNQDGDLDYKKILAAIGPRPTRTMSATQVSSPKSKETPLSENNNDSNVSEKQIAESLYRSVAAAGGGRFKDDPDAKAKEQAAYQEFLKKEKEMRDAVDNPNEVENFTSQSSNLTLDDEDYARGVIASLGPRPKPRRNRIMNERVFSDLGGILATDDDDEEEDDDDDDETLEEEVDIFPSRSTNKLSEFPTKPDDEGMPDWLKEENKGGRSRQRRKFLQTDDIEEAFDDKDYEKNMRQLAEYERRRSGRNEQMGIDISDVFRRSAFDSDDYADYKYEEYSDRERWGKMGFVARKMDLLEYRELDISELNALMDHKDSVYSTGVSQYIPRINRPFKEFGAIFRLEGLLVDTSRLQMKAWSRVAEQYGYKAPALEDVARAASVRPEVAVREILFWSDDFIQCGKIAVDQRLALARIFNDWRQEEGIELSHGSSTMHDQGSFAIGEEVLEDSKKRPVNPPKNEGEFIDRVTRAWSRTASAFEVDTPSNENILQAAPLSPDVAVQRIFKWSSDPVLVNRIAKTYEKAYVMDKEVSVTDEAQTSSVNSGSGTKISSQRPVLNETTIMELHFQAWTTVARTFNFELPEPEEVLAAYVINNPEIAVRDGFGWTSNEDTVLEAVNLFKATLRGLMNDRRGQVRISPERKEASDPPRKPEPMAPLDREMDEIVDIHRRAWETVAEEHDFRPPTPEMARLATKMTPLEVVRRLFRWTDEEVVARAISSSFEKALLKASSSYKGKHNIFLMPQLQADNRQDINEVVDHGPTPDDFFQAAFESWAAVAKQANLKHPDQEEVQFAQTVGPEEAILSGFQWTDNSTFVNELVSMYRDEIRSRLSDLVSSDTHDKESGNEENARLVRAVPGVGKWIQSLMDVEMQCGLISYFDHEQVQVLLEYAGLSNLFPRDKCVTATSGYNRDQQQMLGAALRLERRPDQCVVFDTSPYSAVAAHDVQMRAVSIIGPYPRYDLLSADTTTSSFDELTAMNIRRLFGERVYDQPLVDMQQSQPEKSKRTITKYFWDDE